MENDYFCACSFQKVVLFLCSCLAMLRYKLCMTCCCLVLCSESDSDTSKVYSYMHVSVRKKTIFTLHIGRSLHLTVLVLKFDKAISIPVDISKNRWLHGKLCTSRSLSNAKEWDI